MSAAQTPFERGRALGVVGALMMATGVALGAFGAHGLEGTVSPERLDTYQTAARYHLIHGVGVLAIVALGRGRLAGWWIAAGAVVFSGSLYLLVLTDTPWLGAVAPIGGATMIGGWLALAWTLVRAGPSDTRP